MQALYQVNRFITVDTLGEEELLAKSIFSSTDVEAVGQLIADQSSLKIKKAWWDIYRSPDHSWNGGKELPGLVGVEAYLNSGKDLKRAVSEEAGGLPRELLSECVKGIIQAETFIFEKRGFPSPKAYEEHWDKMYLNVCRYYSHLGLGLRGWFEHIGYSERAHNLYNRSKSCTVCRKGDGNLTASGSFIDSFHELFVQINMDGKGIAATASGNYLRAPDPVCYDSRTHIDKLIGKNISLFNKKEIGELAGGSQGCDHLVDIVYDLSRAVGHVLMGSEI
ncbi:MAG: DUF2889 domain-containing protein [Desulfotomaculaceae bacterium]|nr:DUF2889 domain-containing protein [Desulfotomaculaceae bacterium]